MPITIIPKRVRLTEDVRDVFKNDVIPTGAVGEILLGEWIEGRKVWFVEFFLEGGVARYGDVFPDQADRLKDSV